MSTDDVRLAEAVHNKRTMTPAMPWSLVRCRFGCNGRATQSRAGRWLLHDERL